MKAGWALLCAIMIAAPAHAQQTGPCPASAANSQAAPEDRAAALVAQMTLEEKAGQLRHAAPAISRLSIPGYNLWREGRLHLKHGETRTLAFTIDTRALSAFDEQGMRSAVPGPVDLGIGGESPGPASRA